MERLVEDLLLLARADEGELLRPAALELRPFVTELFDSLTLTAERRFELGEVPDGTLRADEDRIAQVVRNLARNAVEHTGPGGLVRLTVTAQPRGRLEIAVEDDGPGIPAEQRDRVFDRFHRIDTARAPRQGRRRPRARDRARDRRGARRAHLRRRLARGRRRAWRSCCPASARRARSRACSRRVGAPAAGTAPSGQPPRVG